MKRMKIQAELNYFRQKATPSVGVYRRFIAINRFGFPKKYLKLFRKIERQ